MAKKYLFRRDESEVFKGKSEVLDPKVPVKDETIKLPSQRIEPPTPPPEGEVFKKTNHSTIEQPPKISPEEVLKLKQTSISPEIPDSDNIFKKNQEVLDKSTSQSPDVFKGSHGNLDIPEEMKRDDVFRKPGARVGKPERPQQAKIFKGNQKSYHVEIPTNKPIAVGETPGFSFCIISNGKRDQYLKVCLESILSQGISDSYEILVAGKTNLISSDYKFKFLSMPHDANVGKLGAMRQVMANNAIYDKIIFLDDDIKLMPGWVQGLKKFGTNWDILSAKLLNPDGSRYWDWTDNENGYLRLKPYSEISSGNTYCTGGYVICKKRVFKKIHWNVNKVKGQDEDVEFSRFAVNSGMSIKFNPHSVAYLQYHHDGPMIRIKTTHFNRKEDRILFFIDRPGWAFDNIYKQLERFIPFDTCKIFIKDFQIEDGIYDIEKFKREVPGDEFSIHHHLWWRSLELSNPFPNVKKVISVYDHFSWDKGMWSKFIKFCNKAQALFVANKKLQEILMPAKRKLKLLPDGIDRELFPKRETNFIGDKLRVGFAGNTNAMINGIEDIKGFYNIIQPTIKSLDFVELVTMDRSQNYVSHEYMPDFYKSINVYVCMSLAEGTPNTVLEALSSGVPVISTNVGIVSEVLEDGKNGFIIDRTSQSLVEKLKFIWENRNIFNYMVENSDFLLGGWDWKSKSIEFGKAYRHI